MPSQALSARVSMTARLISEASSWAVSRPTMRARRRLARGRSLRSRAWVTARASSCRLRAARQVQARRSSVALPKIREWRRVRSMAVAAMTYVARTMAAVRAAPETNSGAGAVGGSAEERFAALDGVTDDADRVREPFGVACQVVDEVGAGEEGAALHARTPL